MAKYCAFRLASWLIPLLPVWLCYGLAWLAGEAAYRVATAKRAAATANLSRVLGLDPNAPLVKRTVRGAFRTQAYNYVDLFRIPRTVPAALAERVETLNLPAFLHAYQQGKGVIIATAHVGNFDLLVQTARAQGIPVTVLVERLLPDRLFRTVARLRGSHGVRLLPTGPGSLREIVKTLRAGGVVALAMDRNLQGRGAPLPFFGEVTDMPVGAADLGIRTGAAIAPCFGLRLPGRRYRISVEPPVTLTPAVRDTLSLTQALIAVMEGTIREHPEQWVVFEPIWGRTPQEAGCQSSEERTSTPIPV